MLQLSEELLLKVPKELEEIHFLSELENTAPLFLFCEQNLLKTSNERAREFYLKTITQKLRTTGKQNLSVKTVDFYVSNFLTKSNILANEEFFHENCRKYIAKIQVLLTHWLYKDEIENFFDEDSDEYIFSWKENDILNYLEVFNESMRESFCIIQRDLLEFERLLDERNDEEKIVSFLIRCSEKDNTNKRILKILFDTLNWVNKDIIFKKKYADIALNVFENSNNPDPIFYFIVNTLKRFVRPEIGEGTKPNLNPLFQYITEKIINGGLLENIINYVGESKNYRLGRTLYDLFTNKFIHLFSSIYHSQEYITHMINLIEYVAAEKKPNVYFEVSHLFRVIRYFKLSNDILFDIIDKKIGSIISNSQNEDTETLTRKLYAYYSFMVNFSQEDMKFCLQKPYFVEPHVVESSLSAFLRCAYISKIETSFDFLYFYEQISEADPSIFTLQSLVYYIECHDRVLHRCPDEKLHLYFQTFIPSLIDKVNAIENDEHKMPVFKAMNLLFDNPNFACLIYKNDKFYFVELIYDFIRSLDENYILLAEKIFFHLYISKRDEGGIEDVISKIVSILSSFQVDDSNMFQIAQIISFLPEDIIEKNEIVQRFVQELLSCDQELLTNSKYYIKLLIKCLKFQALEKIYQHLAEKPNLELFSMIVKLSTDDIEQEPKEILNNALIFSYVIIDLMEEITGQKSLSPECINYLNNSINYCAPLMSFMVDDKLTTFVDIVINLVNQFLLKVETVQKFFNFFEVTDEEKFIDIAWDMLSNMTTIFCQNNSDIDILYFDSLALEILKFMHFLFSIDSDKGSFIFSQVKPKNFNVLRLMNFLVIQSKSPFSDAVAKSYIAKIKGECKYVKRTLI